MSWKPNETFEGCIVEFLRSLLKEFYPAVLIVARAQNWIINQLNLKEGPFTIRHAKDLRNLVIREGCIKPRYYFSKDFKGLNVGLVIMNLLALFTLYF